MKKQITTLFAIAIAQFGFAQEVETPVQETSVQETPAVTAVQETSTPSATFYGYARGEFSFDTRQVNGARDGNFVTIPLGISKDANGKDLNATPNFNGWGLESRIGVKFTGPDFFGMKSNGVIEGHFFGSTGASINGFGLRNAYVQLSNDNVEILAGQYWHPMFVTNVSPMTYNFNAGHPFQPFNRSPQIRFTTKGNFRFIGALLTELDFKSVGGSAAQSAIPAVHAQVQFGDDSKFVAGAGVNYKTIRPALGDNNIGAFGVLAYAKAKLGSVATWQIYGNYGQNPTELIQFGGIATDTNGKAINNRTFSFWTELFGDFSPSLEWGIFGGFTRDLGMNKAISKHYYGNYANPNDIPSAIIPVGAWRVSPRLGWKSGNTKFTTELDYTSATYGGYNSNGKTGKLPTDHTAGNLRFSVSLIQSF